MRNYYEDNVVSIYVGERCDVEKCVVYVYDWVVIDYLFEIVLGDGDKVDDKYIIEC